jgi:hypothetical protein
LVLEGDEEEEGVDEPPGVEAPVAKLNLVRRSWEC